MAASNLDYNAKRDLIIEKCYECFVERGIENTSVRNLCEAANVNVNTLYYYFANKDDILFECVHYGYRKYSDVMMEAINSGKVEDIIFALIKVWIENSRRIRFFFQAVSSPAYDKERSDQFTNGTIFTDVVCAKIAERLNAPVDLIRGRVHIMLIAGQFLSLWGDDENGFTHCKNIYKDILRIVNK